MKYRLAACCLAILLPCCALGQADPRDDLPVDPIRPAPHGSLGSVLLMTNSAMRVAVEPETGRIVELAFGSGSNVLQVTGAEGGEALRFDSGTNRVTRTAHGWLSADGTRHVRIGGALADGRAVGREIEMADATRSLRVRQEWEGTGEAAADFMPFSRMRVPCPDRVVLPTGPESAFEEGYTMPASGDGQHVMTRCSGSVVPDCAYGGRYTVGSDSAGGWLAAAYQEHLLLVRVGEGPTAVLADGTRLRVLIDRPAGYAELATAGPGPEGNTLDVSLHPLPANLPPCELAEFARRLAE